MIIKELERLTEILFSRLKTSETQLVLSLYSEKKIWTLKSPVSNFTFLITNNISISLHVDDRYILFDDFVIKDDNFLDKWDKIFEDYYYKYINNNLISRIESKLSSLDDKSILREWKINRIEDDLE